MKKEKVLIMITAGMLLCTGCHGQDLENSQEGISAVQNESVSEEKEAGGSSEPENTANAVNEVNTADMADSANMADSAGTGNAETSGDAVNESTPAKTEQTSGDAAPAPEKAVIEGFQFADGREVPVKISMTLEKTQRGEEAYKILVNADSNIAEPGSDEEYIIFTFDLSYDEGEPDEIYLMENRASLESAGLYFALSNGDGNAEEVTGCLSSRIYDLVISKGMSAKGEVAFLHKTGINEPLHFVGFGKDTVFTFEKADVSAQKSVEKALLCGRVGDLGMGYLVYAISGQDGEDYRLYFLESEDRQMPLSEVDINLEEANCAFPDVRAGNAPIGDFSDIYYMDVADLTGDGRDELFIIARYEKDDRMYFDTRVYEISENEVGINYDLMKELNEKYCEVEDYPIEELKRSIQENVIPPKQ